MNNSELRSEDVSVADSGDSAKQSKRNAGSSISDSVMRIGRDEMNLAEFPLAGLASRPPSGATSLVFEDHVWDKGQRRWLNKKLTVIASTEFGLPTALDDEVILGLIQMTYANRFEHREVVFVPADLFRVLGWRGEGRDYSRLESSLNRWMAVTLFCDNAWWDAELQEWMDDRFQILDRFINPNRKRAPNTKRRLPWTIIWSEKVFKSFQDGYLRKLDMDLYRRLNSPVAKRMLRFLDKRFHYTNHLKLDLRKFACERVGFSRNDDNSQLKRRLARAINELEEASYLKPLSTAERFRQIRRGKWEVVFVKHPDYSQKETQETPPSPLESVLVDRGVEGPTAAELVRTRHPEAIRKCVREHDEMLQSGRGSNLGNPPRPAGEEHP